MDFLQLIDNITPEIHQRLRQAVEIGRWPDGTRLTQEQRETTLQAVIAYEARHLDETDRVGYIDRGSKAEDEQCGSHDDMNGEPDSVRWIQ